MGILFFPKPIFYLLKGDYNYKSPDDDDDDDDDAAVDEERLGSGPRCYLHQHVKPVPK